MDGDKDPDEVNKDLCQLLEAELDTLSRETILNVGPDETSTV